MSQNCIRCVNNKRTSFDLLCDDCRPIQELEDLRKAAWAAKEFMDYLRANTGFSDEWPIEFKVAPDVANHVNTLLNRFEETVYKVCPRDAPYTTIT